VYLDIYLFVYLSICIFCIFVYLSICIFIYLPTPVWAEVRREWRKLHNEKLNDLYSSTNIVRVIKSRIMRWVGHVARMGEG